MNINENRQRFGVFLEGVWDNNVHHKTGELVNCPRIVEMLCWGYWDEIACIISLDDRARAVIAI